MATKNESAEIGTVKPKCGKLLFPPGAYYGVLCGKTATYEEAGVLYCKTHHPPTVNAKRAARNEKLSAEFKASHANSKSAADELAAMRKDAARYRWARTHPIALDGFCFTIDDEVETFIDTQLAESTSAN